MAGNRAPSGALSGGRCGHMNSQQSYCHRVPIPLSRLEAHLSGHSKIEVLLRGHLWVEYLLNQGLEGRMVKPRAYNVDRAPFSQKVDLSEALGLTCEHLAAALRSLNRLRNRLAHTLDGEPSNAEVVNLCDAAECVVRRGVDAIYPIRDGHPDEDAEALDRLRVWFYVVTAALEYGRMSRAYADDHDGPLAMFELTKSLRDKYGVTLRSVARSDAELRAEYGLPEPPDPRDVWLLGDEAGD